MAKNSHFSQKNPLQLRLQLHIFRHSAKKNDSSQGSPQNR